MTNNAPPKLKTWYAREWMRANPIDWAFLDAYDSEILREHFRGLSQKTSVERSKIKIKEPMPLEGGKRIFPKHYERFREEYFKKSVFVFLNNLEHYFIAHGTDIEDFVERAKAQEDDACTIVTITRLYPAATMYIRAETRYPQMQYERTRNFAIFLMNTTLGENNIPQKIIEPTILELKHAQEIIAILLPKIDKELETAVFPFALETESLVNDQPN